MAGLLICIVVVVAFIAAARCCDGYLVERRDDVDEEGRS